MGSPPSPLQLFTSTNHASFLRKSSGRLPWSPRGLGIVGNRYIKVRTRNKRRALALFFIAFFATFCLLYHSRASFDTFTISASQFVSSASATCHNHNHDEQGQEIHHEPSSLSLNDQANDGQTISDDQTSSASELMGVQRPPGHLPGTKRRLPQCIIIGVRKCGTRALLEFLNIHPTVQKARDEVHFFDEDNKYALGLDWYRKQMPFSFPGQLTAEKSPAYFVTESAPYRIHAMNSSIKLIIIVRDPVIRLISDYTQLAVNKMAKKDKTGTGAGTFPSWPNRKMPSFENLVLLPSGEVDLNYKPVKTSIYALYYNRWTQVFPKEQIHVVDGDRLVYDPFPEVQRVEQFLSLSHRIKADNFAYNSTKGFYCVKLDGDETEKCLNESKGRRHPDVNPAVVETLRRFYTPYNRQFYKMVGRDFGWPEV